MTMPLMIRADDVNSLAERLAARLGKNKTEAVRVALQHELQRLDEVPPLATRLGKLRTKVLTWPPTGLEADKAFYDDLSGDP